MMRLLFSTQQHSRVVLLHKLELDIYPDQYIYVQECSSSSTSTVLTFEISLKYLAGSLNHFPAITTQIRLAIHTLKQRQQQPTYLLVLIDRTSQRFDQALKPSCSIASQNNVPTAKKVCWKL